MSDPDTELVFVYGTLRQGASNVALMEGAKWVRLGRVRGKLHRLDGYPALIPDEESGSWVVGDIREVSSDLFARLNAYEEEAAAEDDRAAFKLDRIAVAGQEEGSEFGARTEAWVWRWAGTTEGLREVKTGDWLDEE